MVFFESALELIPKSLRNHPLIRKKWHNNLKKKNRGILLDGAVHRPLLNSLEEAEKRGRPDIIHHSLMNIVYSPLFREKKVQVFIHTRNDVCIQISYHWRAPVNYNRFCGLFSQLLLKHRVPLSGEPILTAKHCTLSNLLKQFENSQIFFCDVPTESTKELVLMNNLENISHVSSKVFLIGGFQHGEANLRSFGSNNSIKDWVLLTLYEEVKPAWIIVAKLIHWLEVSQLPRAKASGFVPEGKKVH
jgi:rRNA small subunit pseudouridine methyltransferase Nep1